MVTFVPPDSGPLLGDRPVTVGVYKPERWRERVERDCENKLKEEREGAKERTNKETD